jgi:hypothetical protein
MTIDRDSSSGRSMKRGENPGMRARADSIAASTSSGPRAAAGTSYQSEFSQASSSS